MKLVGKLLIAMPNLDKGTFKRSVIVVCEQEETGTTGIVINKPSDRLSLADLLEGVSPALKKRQELEIRSKVAIDDVQVEPRPEPMPDGYVYDGGPVENARGFVLFAEDGTPALPTTRSIKNGIAFTSTQQVLLRIARHQSPSEYLVCVGRCGWEPGQLENEISKNYWLTGEVSKSILFHTPEEDKWSEAVKTLGFKPENLSISAGRA